MSHKLQIFTDLVLPKYLKKRKQKPERKFQTALQVFLKTLTMEMDNP